MNVKSFTVVFVVLYLLGITMTYPMLYPVMIQSIAAVKMDYWTLTINTARAFKIHMYIINLGCLHIQQPFLINIRKRHYTYLWEVFLNPIYPHLYIRFFGFGGNRRFQQLSYRVFLFPHFSPIPEKKDFSTREYSLINYWVRTCFPASSQRCQRCVSGNSHGVRGLCVW